MELDATFWAFIALLIFIGIMVYVKVPAQVAKALDSRADKIRLELEEARRLRDEAKELLAQYQRRRKEAEAEANQIVTAARHEADLLAQEAKVKTEEFVTRRTAMAEQKIAQAEAQAISEVKASAVDLAIAAAEKLIAAKSTGKTAQTLVANSISEIRAKLN
jgi:F-type H+-transporting ATPase subunit b